MFLQIIQEEKHYWGNEKSWKKLFEPEIEINLDEQYAIGYLCAIILNKYRLVMFEDDGAIIYAMIDLGIDCNIDYDNFYKQLSIYENIV